MSRFWPWGKKAAGADREDIGSWGEDEAARMLAGKGYRILGRRVRFGPKDEIDIVARHAEVLVFVEVKTRADEDFGRPLASVNRAKRRAQSRAAMRYMRRLHPRPPYFRFDVVEVVRDTPSGAPEIRHIESAFTLESSRRVP